MTDTDPTRQGAEGPPRYGMTLAGRFRPFPSLLSRLVQFGLFFPMARLTRGATLGVQAMVRDETGRVLLIRQSYSSGWRFPGGGVDAGETVEDALHRELREEAGLVVEDAPRLFGLYTNFKTLPGDHIAFYVVDRWSLPSFPEPNREIVAHRFFAADALPDDAVLSVRRRLDEVTGRGSRAPHW